MGRVGCCEVQENAVWQQVPNLFFHLHRIYLSWETRKAFYKDRVTVWVPGWPGTCGSLPATASTVHGLQMWDTMAQDKPGRLSQPEKASGLSCDHQGQEGIARTEQAFLVFIKPSRAHVFILFPPPLSYLLLIDCIYLETGSNYIALADLELVI